MPSAIKNFVRFVDRINYCVGRFAMHLLFVLMGILLWSSLTNVFRVNAIWTLEMAQFVMVAYYILGGPYSLQLDSNVRMDLLYHSWSDRTRAWVDAFSVFCLIFYLCVLLYGAIGSTAYSLGYWGDEPFSFFAGLLTGSEEIGRLERSASAWRPYIAPIKIVTIIGVVLMILQALAFFFRDVARLRGEEL